MTYSLRRVRDGAGDCGPMSLSINPNTGTVEGNHPIIGNIMRVGSIYSRTFSMQDWWQTTPVTEIIDETETRVHFRTNNSEYIWRADL